MKSLLIIQPYIASYRVPFFEKLVPALSDRGVQCSIAAPLPQGKQALRHDAVSGAPWHILTQSSTRTFFGVEVQNSVPLGKMMQYDGVITGLAGSSLDAYRALWARRWNGTKVGLWGHVGSYVKAGQPVDLALERLQMRLADQVFSYTEKGANLAIERGVEPERVVSVNNTVSLENVIRAVENANPETVADFKSSYALVDGKVLSFVGGIDDTKRIDYLCQVLDELWNRDREFKLLVGGRGAEEWRLQPAVDRGQCVLFGRVDDAAKALIWIASSAMLLPGRIGLVAVEALAFNLPIFTLESEAHAPEAEYLISDESVFYVSTSASEAADSILERCGDMSKLDTSRVRDASYPSIDDMVARFCRGVSSMFDA